MSNHLKKNQDQILNFLAVLSGDKVLFDCPSCGNYTDHFSEIESMDIFCLRVKVSELYPNPDCVDENNMTNVLIKNIVKTSPIRRDFNEFEIDARIGLLKGYIEKNKNSMPASFKTRLEKLLMRLQTLFNQINSQGANNQLSIDRLVPRSEFDKQFINL